MKINHFKTPNSFRVLCNSSIDIIRNVLPELDCQEESSPTLSFYPRI